MTGAKALYADLGHFGRRPIQLGWFTVVRPALALNYLGQGGLLLRDPQAIANPFFLMGPSWATWPLAVLATAATVIASQALITGAYSLTMQAVQLGYLPRVRIDHTSAREFGQVYLPVVNGVIPDGTELDELVYFLGHETIVASGDSRLPPWRERLFAVLHRNAATPVRYFGLPRDRIVQIGTDISI